MYNVYMLYQQFTKSILINFVKCMQVILYDSFCSDFTYKSQWHHDYTSIYEEEITDFKLIWDLHIAIASVMLQLVMSPLGNCLSPFSEMYSSVQCWATWMSSVFLGISVFPLCYMISTLEAFLLLIQSYIYVVTS